MSQKLPIVHVKRLGLMCFRQALNIQKEATRDILNQLRFKDSKSPNGYLYIVEHNPVYTVGIRNKQYKTDIEKLKSKGADFVETDRGGLVTFHGPGQLVSYPVVYLGNFQSKSIKWYVKELEKTIVDTCNSFGLKAYTCENIGVWVREKKIASIGIHASRYVTWHGLALNCNMDLQWFSEIEPCGLPNVQATSLTAELQRNIPVTEVVPVFLKEFQRHFPCELIIDAS